MSKTPVLECIQRYIDEYQPHAYIPIHHSDVKTDPQVNKIYGKFHLPFKTLGRPGLWGGPHD
jgi:hypothetical protein